MTTTVKINRRTRVTTYPDAHTRHDALLIARATGHRAELIGTHGIMITRPKWSQKHPTAARWIVRITLMIITHNTILLWWGARATYRAWKRHQATPRPAQTPRPTPPHSAGAYAYAPPRVRNTLGSRDFYLADGTHCTWE